MRCSGSRELSGLLILSAIISCQSFSALTNQQHRKTFTSSQPSPSSTLFRHAHQTQTRPYHYNNLSPFRSSRSNAKFILTTKADSSSSEESEPKVPIFRRARNKFMARPGTYLIIPVIAALVGWFTNWLAVQMIFYPIQFKGIPIYRIPEVPLGLIGWQGIIPCKTRTMSIVMVDMVTSQLLTVKEAFARLNPGTMASLLAPQVPPLGMEIIEEVAPLQRYLKPGFILESIWYGLPKLSQSILEYFNYKFLKTMVKDMQQNIDSIFSLQNCVVNQMLQDRAKLGELFRKCGQKELDFLTNSGLWFGFLLGLIQMAVALVWDNPWSLSIGGGIVGLATNWLALKWIFEPVNPTKVGPFILQGQFLRRQTEVAAEFSQYFANKILNSPMLWNSILTDPSTTPAFHAMFTKHFSSFVRRVSRGLFQGTPEPETIALVTRKAIEKLPNYVHTTHEYINQKLGLEHTLRTRMEKMTPAQFERVLHPIFEEDELTLILAGAALGFAAGLVQQGLETGTIANPFPKIQKYIVSLVKKVKRRFRPNQPGTDSET